jgi:hypothetical protein
MAAMRRWHPNCCVTAKTQRWNPEEFLRTLVEAEIAARDASNAAPERKRVPGGQDPRRVRRRRVLDPGRPSTTSPPGMDPGAENVCLIGPPAPGSPHCSSRSASPRRAGHRVRYFTAADLVETLYRGLADNCVGRSSTPCSATT